jgi:hypothetical protein
VRECFNPLEADFKAQLPKVMAQAVSSNGTVDATILDDFTAECVARVVETIRGLLREFEG